MQNSIASKNNLFLRLFQTQHIQSFLNIPRVFHLIWGKETLNMFDIIVIVLYAVYKCDFMLSKKYRYLHIFNFRNGYL